MQTEITFCIGNVCSVLMAVTSPVKHRGGKRTKLSESSARFAYSVVFFPLYSELNLISFLLFALE